MKTAFLLLIASLLLVSCATGGPPPSPAAAVSASPGEMSSPRASGPDFTLKDLKGTQVSLSQFKNIKAVMLVFWATWCPACNEEIPTLVRLQEKFKDRGLVILAVSVSEKERLVQSFAAKKGLPYTVLLDSDGTVAKAWGIMGIPMNIVFNKKGEQVYRDNALPPDTEAFLEKLL